MSTGRAIFTPGSEDKTDVRMKDRVQGKQESHHVPQPFWQSYNLLPLMAATLVTVVALGGIIFYLNLSDWPKSPEPKPGPPSQEEGPTDRLPESDGDKEIQGPVKSPGDKSTEEPVEKAVTVTQKPPTHPKVISQPPTGKKTFAPSRQQLDQLLSDFQAAYERQDSSSLEHLSDISPDRQMFLDMMSNNYSLIKTSIQDVKVKKDQATATLIHEQLIDKNGEQVAPDQILRSIRITVRKEGDHWSKVLW